MKECLGCGKKVDDVICVSGKGSPRPGDVTVCLYCGHIMVFVEGGDLRNPTSSEMDKIAGDRRVIALQRARKSSG